MSTANHVIQVFMWQTLSVIGDTEMRRIAERSSRTGRSVLVGRKMLSGVCLVLSSDPSQSRSILTILLCRVLNERYLLCLLSSHSDTHGTVSGRRLFGTLMTSNHGSLPSLSCGSFSPAVVFIDPRANTHKIHNNIHMYHLIRASIVTLTFFSIYDRFQMS